MFIQDRAYNEGYKQGVAEERENTLYSRYPITVNAETNYGPFAKGQYFQVAPEYQNPTDKDVRIKGFTITVPSEDWLVQKGGAPNQATQQVQIPIPVTENATQTKQVVVIQSRSDVFPAHAVEQIPANPLVAAAEGTWPIKFCIEYADGTQTCPRTSVIEVR